MVSAQARQRPTVTLCRRVTFVACNLLLLNNVLVEHIHEAHTHAGKEVSGLFLGCSDEEEA